ncbi:MAG: hypothetical protein IJ371_02170, partial [Clostridia bacterium]|nr:hypothetical protein [Clostridia bacterium]
PYYINFATDLELEPCYNDQIGYYVITSLKPLTESCPQIIERYSLDENSRFSKFDIIDLEEEIINELYPNQKRVCTF